jgi:phosphoserine phosphatase RsbU/P
MAKLVVIKGPQTGQEFALTGEVYLISRLREADICLTSTNVSRRHAQILCRDHAFVVEDLGSVNGTFLNGQRLKGSQALVDGDQLQVAEYTLVFRKEAGPPSVEAIILTEVAASPANVELFADNPAGKLQIVLELARDLGQTQELQPLLEKVLDNLLRLFPLADEGLVVLSERDRLVVRAQRSRTGNADFRFSRTVVRQALASGSGVLSSNIRHDERFVSSSSLQEVEASSVLCVPLLVHAGRPLGAIQLDCTQPGQAFQQEHLRMLTTVALQVAVVVDYVALNTIRMQQEALRRDLALGREIQFGFLPTDFTPLPGKNFEIFACIHPAREVSGDLYDFFALDDGRLVFLVGDVSDKGISAALFMVKVHTLIRHLAMGGRGPAELLAKLNAALAVNNPSSMFVTVVLGVYDPPTGAVVLASGGHPRPLRHANGKVEEIPMSVGRLLGCFEVDPGVTETHLILDRGEMLILYSDGYTEATGPNSKLMLGLAPFTEMLGGARTQVPLATCADKARLAVERFIGGTELQDDLTLLLLRRG